MNPEKKFELIMDTNINKSGEEKESISLEIIQQEGFQNKQSKQENQKMFNGIPLRPVALKKNIQSKNSNFQICCGSQNENLEMQKKEVNKIQKEIKDEVWLKQTKKGIISIEIQDDDEEDFSFLDDLNTSMSGKSSQIKKNLPTQHIKLKRKHQQLQNDNEEDDDYGNNQKKFQSLNSSIHSIEEMSSSFSNSRTKELHSCPPKTKIHILNLNNNQSLDEKMRNEGFTIEEDEKFQNHKYYKWHPKQNSALKKNIWDKEIKDGSGYGVQIHKYMEKIFSGINRIEEEIQLFTDQQKEFLDEYAEIVKKYIRIKGLEIFSVETCISIGQKQKPDLLVKNDNEAIIIDWKHKDKTIKSEINSDCKERYLKQFDVVQKRFPKLQKITLMIMPLRRVPIDFVEYSKVQIMKIQDKQENDDNFQKENIDEAMKQLFNNKEQVMKRKLTFKQETKSLQEFHDIFRAIIHSQNKEEYNSELIQHFNDIKNSRYYRKNSQNINSYRININEKTYRLNNFFILHILLNLEDKNFSIDQLHSNHEN